MHYEFEQTSPTEWEVRKDAPDGRYVWKFDRCVINYHKRLNPQLVSVEKYNKTGRITYWWQRAQHFRGKPDMTLWVDALQALAGRLSQ
jgi:hypothetical protein